MKVHFICMGNIFRSYIAETHANSLNLVNFHFSSSGLIANEVKEECQNEHDYIVDLLRSLGYADNKINQEWGKTTSQDVVKNMDVCVFMSYEVERIAKEKGLVFKKTRSFNIHDINEGPYVNSVMSDKDIIQEQLLKICKLVDDLIYNIKS